MPGHRAPRPPTRENPCLRVDTGETTKLRPFLPLPRGVASLPAVPDPIPSPPLLVACLCAQWCGTCRDYRAVFDAAAAGLGPAAQFAWVDIEDEAAVVDDVDVEDFPTLLIARAGAPLFYGPLTPQPGMLARLLQGAQADTLGRLADPALADLAARIEARVPRRPNAPS